MSVYKLTLLFLGAVLSWSVNAAYFPVDELPTTTAQTWGSNKPNVELDTQNAILNALNGNQLGYRNGDIDNKKSNTCGSGNVCVGVASLRGDEPDWSVPSGAQSVTIQGNKTLSEGVYDATGSEVKLDDSTLTINGDVTLYVNKMTVQSSGTIIANNDATLVVVARDSGETVSLKGNSSFKGHFFTRGFFEIAENVTLTGTATTDDLKIYDNAQLVGELPTSLPPGSCEVKGQNDFTISFEVEGDDEDYQEFYLKQGSHGHVLWYTQSERSDSDYIFNEQKLEDDEDYEIIITNDASSSTLNYYRRLAGDGNPWSLIETKIESLHNGSLVPDIDDDDITNISCEDSINPPVITPPSVTPDICTYVPETVQTNAYASGPILRGQLAITNGTQSKIIPADDSTTFSFLAYQGGPEGCEYPSSGLQACNVDSNKFYEDFPPVLESYSTDGAENVSCESDDCDPLLADTYKNVSIKEGQTLVLSGGEYWFNRLTFEGDGAKLDIEAASIVHFKHIRFNGSSASDPIQINADTKVSEDLLLIGHNEDAYLHIDSGVDGIEVYAYIYIDSLADDRGGFDISGNDNNFYGGVSAFNVNLSGFSNVIHSRSEHQCVDTDDSYTVSMTPAKSLSLTCGSDRPTFDLKVQKNGEDLVNESVDINIELFKSALGDSSFLSAAVSGGIGSGSGSQFTTTTSGELQLQVSTSSISNVELDSDYTIQASLADYDAEVQSSLFKYVPFMFDVEPQFVIAGQPKSIDARVLACKETDGSEVIATNYNGSPNTQSSIIEPSDGLDGNLSYTPTFNSGEASADLTLDESGEFEVTISDSFNCTGYQNCPDEGSVDVSGEFSVYSRPWTFAICEENGANISGTSTDGDGYVAVGDNFELRLRPVVWQSNWDGSSPVNTLNGALSLCDADITQNFFLSGATAASVTLSNGAFTPSGGTQLELSGSLSKANTEGAGSNSNQYLPYSALAVNEAGSLSIIATSDNQYLTMDIDSGTRSVGRFYPKYFSIFSQTWTYPSSQSFIYMGQNFETVEFEVQALDADEEAIFNYAHANYSSDLRAEFNLSELGSYTTRFVSPSFGEGVWSDDIGSIGTFSHTPSSLSICEDSTSLCFIKNDVATGYEDGPFNLNGSDSDNTLTTPTDISIVLATGNTDPVEFVTGGQKLDDQPDIRFGRVDLDDVGGNAGATLTVPLRTEYWNGSRFMTNDDDSSTSVDAEMSNREILWSPDSDTTTVTLGGGGDVTSGESRNITASQDDDVELREQIQLWQDMDDTPWLRYNWDSTVAAEEDPSSVATFGIYRGNDRVIYRGESRLTGQ